MIAYIDNRDRLADHHDKMGSRLNISAIPTLRQRLSPQVHAWVEEAVGAGLTSFGRDPVPVIGLPTGLDGPSDVPPGSAPAGPPLRAIRLDHGSMVTARTDWLEALRPIVTA